MLNRITLLSCPCCDRLSCYHSESESADGADVRRSLTVKTSHFDDRFPFHLAVFICGHLRHLRTKRSSTDQLRAACSSMRTQDALQQPPDRDGEVGCRAGFVNRGAPPGSDSQPPPAARRAHLDHESTPANAADKSKSARRDNPTQSAA